MMTLASPSIPAKIGITLAILWVLSTSAPGLADGMVIPPTATAKITIPDQAALIHYANGTETLAIETRFIGAGGRFAWVVPLPAIPQITPVSAGLFPTLRILFQPTVVHNVPRYYVGAILFCLPIILILLRWYGLLAWYAVLLLIAAIVLPSLGTAGSETSSPLPTDSVVVHERKIIGEYETATISGKTADDLLNWLKENQFFAPDSSKSVIADYVKEGWVFAAIKLHRTQDTTAPTTPHPLAFTFKTNKPVYPLRLTGTHEGRCTIDLYVFGAERAVIPGFTPTCCTRPLFFSVPASDYYYPDWVLDHKVPVGHPELKKLVDGATVATKLTATLSAGQMRQDAFVGWEEFSGQAEVVYSRQGVARIMENAAISIICLVGVAMAWAPQANRASKKVAGRVFVVAVPIATLLGLFGYACWPKQDVRLAARPQSYNSYAHQDIAAMLYDAAALNMGEQPTRGWCQTRVAFLLHSPDSEMNRAWRHPGENNFTGQPRIEEDSPGNYGFRFAGKGIEYLWYDRYGGEHAIPLQLGSKAGG